MNAVLISNQRMFFIGWLVLVAAFGLLSAAKLLTWLLVLPGLVLLMAKRDSFSAEPEWRQLWFWLGLCWLLPGILAMPDALNPERAWHQWWRLLSYGLAAASVFACSLASQYQRWFLQSAAVVVMFFALDGLAQYLLGRNSIGLTLFADGRYPSQITGFLGVDYGWVIAVLSPLVWLGLAASTRVRNLLWLAMPLMLAVVLLSGSRASFFMALLGILTVVFQQYTSGDRCIARQALLPAVAALITAILMVVFVPDLQARWQDLMLLLTGTQEGNLKALSLRPLLWGQGITVFQEHWLNGVGLRGFAEMPSHELLPPKPQGWSTHLAVLDVATDTGIIGLVGYTLFYVTAVRWWWRTQGASNAFGLAALLALAPVGSTLPLYSARVGNMGWMCLAMALALAMSQRRGEH